MMRRDRHVTHDMQTKIIVILTIKNEMEQNNRTK